MCPRLEDEMLHKASLTFEVIGYRLEFDSICGKAKLFTEMTKNYLPCANITYVTSIYLNRCFTRNYVSYINFYR